MAFHLSHLKIQNIILHEHMPMHGAVVIDRHRYKALWYALKKNVSVTTVTLTVQMAVHRQSIVSIRLIACVAKHAVRLIAAGHSLVILGNDAHVRVHNVH
jgi:hypothetical protein